MKSPSFPGSALPGVGLLRGLRQRTEGWPLFFLAVVFGVALLFRGGIGWARSLTTAAAAPDEAAAKPASPASRERLRAQAGGVATVAAVTRARARALVVTRSPAQPALPATAEAAALVAPAAPASDPPSPSFVRAQREFGHRHVEGAVDMPRPLPHPERPVTGRGRGRAPRR